MTIANVIGSESHSVYLARVLEEIETENAPSPEDFGFGFFVKIPAGNLEIFGVTYDTILYSPRYLTFGSRFVSSSNREIFAPDQINENAILIKLLLIGYKEADAFFHRLPKRVINIGAEVLKVEDDEIRNFHYIDGELKLGYFSQILSQTGNLSIPLIESIIEKLEAFAANSRERKKLDILRRTVKLRQSFGEINL